MLNSLPVCIYLIDTDKEENKTNYQHQERTNAYLKIYLDISYHIFFVLCCVVFLCSFSKNCDLKQNYFAHKITVYLHVHGYFVISCVKNIK